MPSTSSFPITCSRAACSRAWKPSSKPSLGWPSPAPRSDIDRRDESRCRAVDARQGGLIVPAHAPEASDQQAQFLAELIDNDLLLPSGVPGVYGHGAIFEDVRSRLDERLSAEAG